MKQNTVDNICFDTKQKKSIKKPYEKKGYKMKYSILLEDGTVCTVSELARKVAEGTDIDECDLAGLIRNKLKRGANKDSVEVAGKRYSFLVKA